jgi:chorismate mutase
MNSGHILMMVNQAIENSQVTPEELVQLLEITVEDIVRKFPKKIVEHADKFGVYPEEDEEWSE